MLRNAAQCCAILCNKTKNNAHGTDLWPMHIANAQISAFIATKERNIHVKFFMVLRIWGGQGISLTLYSQRGGEISPPREKTCFSIADFIGLLTLSDVVGQKGNK